MKHIFNKFDSIKLKFALLETQYTIWTKWWKEKICNQSCEKKKKWTLWI